jgi:hypothetical protein
MKRRWWIRTDTDGKCLQQRYTAKDLSGTEFKLVPETAVHALGMQDFWLFKGDPIGLVRRKAVKLVFSSRIATSDRELVVEVHGLDDGEKVLLLVDGVRHLTGKGDQIQVTGQGMITVELVDKRYRDISLYRGKARIPVIPRANNAPAPG